MQLPEKKRRYTFEVFYRLFTKRISDAINSTGALALLEKFMCGEYE